MSERAECHARMAYVRLVREHDFEDGDVADDGGGDCRDQEEDGCDEEEGHADPGALLVSCLYHIMRWKVRGKGKRLVGLPVEGRSACHDLERGCGGRTLSEVRV